MTARVLRYFAVIGIALSITAGIALRLYRPAADPPQWLYVYNTDEGHYSYNTHNKIKYGEWFVNEAKYALITPLFDLAQYFAAAALPNQPNIVRYRAISLLSGILSCFALWFFFAQPFVKWAAVALASISFMGVVHSRIGIPEMTLTLVALVTALLAIEGEKRRSFVLYMAAGAVAVACAAIKPTGLLIAIVLVTIPVLHRGMSGHRIRYFSGIGAGGIISGAALISIVVVPHYSDWLKMVSAATSIGAGSVDPNLQGLLGSLLFFFLSPAMQTMPILWPLAIYWSVFVFPPRLKNRENDFEETLLFLWLGFGILMLGLPSYQPARWQLLIFPPVIVAGLRSLLQIRSTGAMTAALALAVIVSAASSLTHGAGFLRLEQGIEPGLGIFSHVLSFAIAGAVFLAGVATAKISKLGWRNGMVYGALLLEISVQAMLHSVYMWPSYFRESQWSACSSALEGLRRGDTDVFAGSMVQDLALRADIRVLPAYYVLDDKQVDDGSVRDFFLRQKQLPDYFLLLDIQRPLWATNAPRFMSSLEPIGRCRLLIGDLGVRNLYVYRPVSDDWLK